MTQQDLFADAVGAVHVTGNLVRMDLTTMQPGTGKGRQELTARLILPLEGFVNAFNLQEQIIRQLTQNGILTDGRIFPAVPKQSQSAQAEAAE